ncbi:hypothetical protein L1987_68913 [Smallanthus sonchifolius]|uniref:Uncharacterized protein n=1 Tax=Smallanthus sonchifolius TaxID=185202 RepID=A0ACB9B697_9ASTR|nr:hypothetical protein L1987_68913 [Smallanthus sonchifolius]
MDPKSADLKPSAVNHRGRYTYKLAIIRSRLHRQGFISTNDSPHHRFGDEEVVKLSNGINRSSARIDALRASGTPPSSPIRHGQPQYSISYSRHASPCVLSTGSDI